MKHATRLRTWAVLALLASLMLIVILPSHHARAQDVANETRALLLAHYMPWYQTPDVSGYWGWHWTMDHFNPENTDADGRPEIASQYMPLTGPYDSQDDAVLEYQVLLMKLSGIDGVIVDWYGIEDFRDYAVLNAATVRLFDYVKRAGLRFVICYEDQTIRHMISDGHIDSAAAIERGREDLRFMQEHWFTDDAYVTYNGQPLLFVFGPQYFRSPADWEALFDGTEPAPALVTLDNNLGFAALSSYPWPPMNMAGGITLAPAALDAYLDLFYRNARRRDLVVGSAFPAFHDIYAQAGVRSSYGFIDPLDGETLRHTLDVALTNDARIVQLVTWNDYGEGTIIEPTEEFGTQYLEIVQETRRSLEPEAFAFTADDLALPLRLFHLRREYAGDNNINTRLDDAFSAIIAGDTSAASDILDELEG